MKLYIWEYTGESWGSWSAGVVFAIAESLPQARYAIAHGKAFCGAGDESPEPRPGRPSNESTGNMARWLGKPNRIIDLDKPYAEWHEWN